MHRAAFGLIRFWKDCRPGDELPWQSLAIDLTHGSAADAQPTDWLHLLAVKA